MNEKEILIEFGKRLQHARINADLKQQEVTDRAAISRATLVRAEQGLPMQTGTLFRILKVLGEADRFVDMLPEVEISPRAMARLTLIGSKPSRTLPLSQF